MNGAGPGIGTLAPILRWTRRGSVAARGWKRVLARMSQSRIPSV
jgi:hypothetical protein